MMVINNINDLNETLSVHVDDRSYRYRRIMADDKVFLYFSLPEFIEILPGAWITYQGAKYTMNKPADFKKNHSRHYDYTLEFDSPAASLLKYRLRDVVERRLKFPLLANARQHLQMIVDNLNMRESGWTMGSCIETHAKLISYNHTTLAQALQMVADNFETEFEIVDKEISLGRIERNHANPIALSYGKGNGFLPGVGRFNDVESAAIKVLHVQGGTRNINRSSYGSPTLLLPASQSLQYEGSLYEVSADGHTVSLADAPAQAPEGSLDLADIYPSRVGEISQVIPVDASRNFYDFVDSSIPAGLDFNDCHMPGEKMTVIFQSGMLAGREFEINSYKHALRRFELVPVEENGLELPSGPFVPTVGDTYAIFGIELPAAYVREDNTQSGASWDMLREAVRYLHDNSRPKFSFTGTLDGIWAKKDWLNIGGRIQLGSYVLFSDPTFEPAGVHIRIVGIKDFVNSPESPELELSNNVISSSFTSRLAKIEQNEVVTQELHRQSMSFTKRRFQDAARTVAMLEQAFSNNFTKAISPAAIHTMSALVGDESLQYRFVNSTTNPQEVTHVVTYNPSTLVLNAPAGIIQHMTLGLESISPGHLASEYHFWNVTAFNSPPLSNPDSSYYLYIKANKASMAASFALSESPIAFEHEAGYYHLLVGILNAELAGERSYVSLYGFTEILPGRITTNKIVSADGNTFIDLQTGDIQGKFTFRSGRDVEEVIEEVEGSIEDQQIYVEYSVNGSTNWHTTFTEGDLYMRQKKGAGAWSAAIRIVGEAGAAGATGPEGRYTDYQFAKNTSATTAPTSGWQDSPPAISAWEYVWMRTGEVVPPAISPSSWSTATRVTGDKGAKGDKGDQGVQGIAGPKGADGVTYYTWVKYADSPTSGMSDYPSGKAYMGLAHNKTTATESSNYADYTWSLIKGTDGQPGAPGANGQTLYTWIKYADTPTSGMSDSPTGKTYIGLAVNKTTASESSSYGDYTWSLIKGADGRSVTGTDVEFAQSTSATVAPTSGWQTTAPAWESGKYIWHRTKTTYSTGDPTYSAAVNLTGSPGSTGSTGATGTGVDSITEEYYLSTSKTTQAGGSWSVNPPTWEMGKYMWTRVKIVYKDPASTVYTTPVVSSEWEAVDAVQVGGRNLLRNTNKGTTNWAIDAQSGTGTWTVSASLDGGIDTVLFTKTVHTDSGWAVPKITAIPPSKISADADYVVSFYAKSNYEARGTVKLSTHTNTPLANSPSVNIPSSESWVKITAKITTLPNYDALVSGQGTIVIRMPATGATAAGDYIQFKDVKLELGNRATDWTPAPEDVDADIATAQTAANSANTAVGNLSGYVDGAFKDGVIDTAEAKAIEKYKNSLSETKLSVDGSYTKLYNNAYLTGTPKSNLLAAKTALNTAYTNLVNSINTAIADGKTTAAEKSDVDSKFGLFNTALATYRVRVEEANAAIQVAVEGAAKAYTDNIEVGGRNYALNTSMPRTKSSWTGANNQGMSLYIVNVAPEWEVGKQVTIAFDVEAIGIAWGGGTVRLATQSYGDVTSYDGFGYHNFFSRPGSYGSGQSFKTRVVYQVTLTAAMLTNQRYTFSVRCDYIAGGSLSIKNFALFYGNKATDWTPAPEDVPVPLDFLTKALQGTTEIDGGLILASVLAARDSGGFVRSYQNGDPALNDIAFAAGVENFGVSGETQNIALKHSGAAKIGAFSVSDTGEIELIDPSTQIERLRFATVNLPSISSLYNGVAYSGTPSIGSGNTSGTQTLTGSFTIAHDGVSVSFNSGTVMITGTGRSFGGGLSSYAKAELALYRGSTLITSFGSAQIHFTGTTPNSDSLSNPFSARSVILNAGTYTFRLVCTSGGEVTTKNAISTAFTGSYSYNLRNVKRQQYGLDGMMLFYSNNHFHFTENGGLDARTTNAGWNAPGVLLSGYINTSGQMTSYWGAKFRSGTYRISTGNYRINHSIGHSGYRVLLTANGLPAIGWVKTKTNTYVDVEFINTSNSIIDAHFDFAIIGNNY